MSRDSGLKAMRPIAAAVANTAPGQASARIEALLSYGGPDALIHRDDLVMLVR